MSKTDAQHAYARGYYAGSRCAWPKHKPPVPPEPHLAELLRAANALRNVVDGLLATLGEDDELEKELGPKVDEYDAAMEAVTEWLRAVV